ncbi:transposable element Tcb1 transposase [Trichonephila clavipes]|nr:transposable element Tcb1 transposase [Trichonephila clavipes]
MSRRKQRSAFGSSIRVRQRKDSGLPRDIVDYLSGKSVVVLGETKQLYCGYVTVGCRRVRRTDVVDRIHLSVQIHCLRVPFDAVYRRVVCPQDFHCLVLPLTQNHRRLRHQWCDEKEGCGRQNGMEIFFTDESRIYLQHHDGRNRVWRHHGERMLNSFVIHRHSGPAPGIMVWGGIGYHSRTPLVRIAGTLNSQRYIAEVLEPVVLPYLQGLATAIFQQDNARPHVARIFQRFFVNHQIVLLPGWLALRIFRR